MPKALEAGASPFRIFAPSAGLLQAMEKYVSGPRASENLKLLAEGKASLVVTGQQPSFPMPLGLTLAKAATTVAIAERHCGKGRLVPLFWNGSDDSDFEEASSQNYLRASRPPLRFSLPVSLHRKNQQVGRLAVEGCLQEILAYLPPEYHDLASSELGDLHARTLARFYAEDGLLVLDARSPALAEAGKQLYENYLESRERFAGQVDRDGDSLEKESGSRPLRRGVGERALYLLSRDRRSLPEPADYENVLRERLREKTPRLSPNVSLRPLLQDFVLPVREVVLGPSEWEYHRQLRDSFSLLGCHFPQPWPRLQWNLRSGEPRDSSPLFDPHARPDQVRRDLLEQASLHLEDLRENRYLLRSKEES
jgi:uncharacterized protein YllA (UPF0747 family)